MCVHREGEVTSHRVSSNGDVAAIAAKDTKARKNCILWIDSSVHASIEAQKVTIQGLFAIGRSLLVVRPFHKPEDKSAVDDAFCVTCPLYRPCPLPKAFPSPSESYRK